MPPRDNETKEHRGKESGCPFTTSNPRAYSGHMKGHRKGNKRTPVREAGGAYKCADCPATFKTATGLGGHRKVHRKGTKPSGKLHAGVNDAPARFDGLLARLKAKRAKLDEVIQTLEKVEGLLR